VEIPVSDEERMEYFQNAIISLDFMIRLVNSVPDTLIPITLTVKGMLISGKLMSLKQFHEELGITITDSLRNETPEFRREIREFAQNLFKLRAVDENGHLAFNYVCMKDPVFHLGGRPVEMDMAVPIWIGKIESVDGYFLGNILYENSETEDTANNG
jgi:hypothetical protein